MNKNKSSYYKKSLLILKFSILKFFIITGFLLLELYVENSTVIMKLHIFEYIKENLFFSFYIFLLCDFTYIF